MAHGGVCCAVVPVVRTVFNDCQELRSCALAVAQYDADEASDGVHAKLSWSERDTRDLDAAQTAYQRGSIRADTATDTVNLPAVGSVEADSYDVLLNGWGYELIPLFAAYCVERATQDDEDPASHRTDAAFAVRSAST